MVVVVVVVVVGEGGGSQGGQGSKRSVMSPALDMLTGDNTHDMRRPY